MEKIYNIFLGLPPHNIDINHPLHSNFGLFFHLKKSSNLGKQYRQVTDWLDLQDNIQNFHNLKQLEYFINRLDKTFHNKINLVIFSKKEFLAQSELQLILNIVEELNNLKHIDIDIKSNLNNFEIFYSKLEFYKFMKENNFQQFIPEYSLLYEDKSVNNLSFPLLIRNSVSSGGKDTFVVSNMKELKKIKRLLYFKNLIWSQNKKQWFVQEFIDTKLKFGYYRSFRVLAFNSKPYFIYPNVSYSNPITHVSEKDKLPKHLFLESVNFGIDIFNIHKNLFTEIFKKLDNPFSALDFVCTDSDNVYISEAELKYGPSEKYVINQIQYFDLDQEFFNDIRSRINIDPLNFDDLNSIFE